MDPKYEKELKRLRNSSDPKYREDNGFVPWMDEYVVLTFIHTPVGCTPQSNVLRSALYANEIIRNMMRVV